jgi:hypothetical protein
MSRNDRSSIFDYRDTAKYPAERRGPAAIDSPLQSRAADSRFARRLGAALSRRSPFGSTEIFRNKVAPLRSGYDSRRRSRISRRYPLFFCANMPRGPVLQPDRPSNDVL